MREKILQEIRRLAAQNVGKAPGRKEFERETGIREHEWSGKYWARWSDAVIEAGFAPNEAPERIKEDFCLQKLASAVRYHSRIPTNDELKLYRRNTDSSFPSIPMLVERLGPKEKRLEQLAEYIKSHPEFNDILTVIGDRSITHEDEKQSPSIEGYVYLIKSGNKYKIGRTGNLKRRLSQINLPDGEDVVHSITTDDPVRLEAYWHDRFSDRRVPKTEFFKLTPSDVKIFKRCKRFP